MMRHTFKKILSFTKIEHTVFSLPLIFAGAWLGAGYEWPSWRHIALLVLAGIGARILGMSMNRIFDRRIDAKNPRTQKRELVTGELSMPVAWGIAAGGFILYEVACYLFGPLILLLSPLPAVALIIYSLLKRFTPLCHYGIGLVMGLAPAGAHVAVRGAIQPEADIWLLTIFAFLWISGFDIIYALLDMDFDKKHKVRSIPAALGPKSAQVVAALTHMGAFAALIGFALVRGGSPWAVAALLISAVGFVCAYLPFIPLPTRFFPISAVAGIAGAAVPFLS